jgi:tripartite-type tricarboxylate transporter receptor subunit TctC
MSRARPRMATQAGTPPPIVDRLASVLGKALASPDIKARFTAQGTEVFLLPPKEFAAYVQEDARRLPCPGR